MQHSSQQPCSSASESDAVLELRDVSYVYPGSVTALDSVSVRFVRGRRTVLMGRNGSGKTTLLSLLNGVAQATSGELLFRAQRVDASRAQQRELRRAVGMVFQDADSQVFSASVSEDVSFGPMNLGLDLTEVRSRVETALSALGVLELAGRPVHSLSYGQKKRVSLAGVIAMRPEVLVLDEPFSGLDRVIASELMEVLSRMHDEGMTLIVATHDVDFAYEWADDAVVLDGGRVLAAGEACDVLAMPEAQGAIGATPFVLQVARAAGLEGSGPLRSRARLLQALRKEGGSV